MPNQDPLSTLEEKIPQAVSALESKKFGIVYDQVLEKISDVDRQVGRVNALSKSAQLISRHMSSDRRKRALDHLEEIIDFSERMKSADKKEDLEMINRDYKIMETEISNLARLVKDIIEEYISHRINPFKQLGNLLVRIGQNDLGDSLIQLGARGDRPDSVEILDWPEYLKNMEETARDLEKEITTVTENPDIDKFLIALSGGRVTLEFVTKEVLEWLAEQNALGEFRDTSQ